MNKRQRKPLKLIISEIEKDLEVPINNKTEFLALCAYEKIITRNLNYEEQFDKYLKLLEINELHQEDLNRITSVLTSLSKLTTEAYTDLINMLSLCDKNIFNKNFD